VGKQIVKWLLMMFMSVMLVANAGLSYAFGSNYLGKAFGLAGILVSPVGGLYALLIADIAYVVWFVVYMKLGETTVQRAVALGMMVVCLALSIMFTVNQLSVHSFDLVDLRAYHDSIGLAALILMIVVTVLIIVSLAVFALFSREESVRRKAMKIQSEVIDDAMDAAENELDGLKASLTDQVVGNVESDVVRIMGYKPGVNGHKKSKNGHKKSKNGHKKSKKKKAARGSIKLPFRSSNSE
jgi:hypothetical protein